MEKKIILVLFPTIINKFDFQLGDKEFFLDLANIKKSFLQKNPKSFRQEEFLDLVNIDYSSEVWEIIKKRPEPKIVLVNYPQTAKNFVSLNQVLAKEGQKINNLILLNISNYELISSIQGEYLICPLCEKIYKKEEVIKEDKKFVCPNDKQYQFLLEKINKFNEYVIRLYLENIKELIEKFLESNNPSNISQLTVNKKEEIFSGEIQKLLLTIIRNIK